jgi:HAD superfamily hydrolase (TIGR01459 family)
MNRIDVGGLIDRYDVFFLDIYGVLVSSRGALPGAAAFLRRIRDAGKSFLLLSNDASRSPDTALERYGRFGLELRREQILSSGMLLADHYAAEKLAGKPTIVLGTDDTADYVRAAGGRVVAADDTAAEVVVVGDDDGYPFLETLNEVISVLLRRHDAGLRTHLVLPNPDLLFPLGGGKYGLTAGAVAALIEQVLRVRDPGGGPRFVPLGKPHAPIFAAAMRKSPTQDKARIVMLGDQFATDVRGARDFGLDAAFVETGIGRVQDAELYGVRATWVLGGLDGAARTT